MSDTTTSAHGVSLSSPCADCDQVCQGGGPMSPRPKAKTTKAYVDIIPAELRAQFNDLASKHTALVLKSGSRSADEWAELAEIEDAQADLLVQLHRLFYDHDPLIADVMNSAHVDARHEARTSRKHAAALRGES